MTTLTTAQRHARSLVRCYLRGHEDWTPAMAAERIIFEYRHCMFSDDLYRDFDSILTELKLIASS